MLEYVLIALIKSVVVFFALLLTVAYLALLVRRVAARPQVRAEPTRMGAVGLVQLPGDGIEVLPGEHVLRSEASRRAYALASILSLAAAFATFAVVPFGSEVHLFGRKIALSVADINIGVLYVFAVSSLGVYGITFGARASVGKYSLVTGLRSAAQAVSYELCLVFSVMGVVMITRSMSLSDVVDGQARFWFALLQPVGFLIFLVASFVAVSGPLFCQSDSENGLARGSHAEYGRMKFSAFPIGEYGNMIAASAMITTFFLGGWQGPFLPPPVWFLAKVFVLLFLFVWMGGTLPKFRYDQLMKFGWKVLLPLSIANVVATGVVLAFVS